MHTKILVCVACFPLLAASCGRGERPQGLAVSGSSTLAPLMEVMLDGYVKSGFDGPVSLDSIGSGAGIRRYLKDECDIVSASRAMTAAEESEARALGKDTVGVVVAMDAVALCTGGGVAGDVARDELRVLLTADTWSDVRLEWPDVSIEKYYPGQDSGTFDFMVDTVFDGDTGPILASAGLQLSEDDHVLVQGLMGDPWALGFFGYSYYADRRDVLTIFSIDGHLPEDGGDYPLSRPLYLYFDAAEAETADLASAFVRYVLETVAAGNRPPGFLTPPDSTVEEGLRTLSSLSKGRVTP